MEGASSLTIGLQRASQARRRSALATPYSDFYGYMWDTKAESVAGHQVTVHLLRAMVEIRFTSFLLFTWWLPSLPVRTAHAGVSGDLRTFCSRS
jgi:hypothetical protein